MVLEITYDALNRAIAAKNGEDGISRVVYDADGRITKVIDEEGGETSYAYDKDDRLISMTDAEGYSTTFTYDAMDRVVTITDARNGVTRYTYTDRGEVATRTDAEGYVTSYEYDGNGNLVSKTDPDGYTTEYTYNALDLVTSINYNNAKEVSYRYNKTGDLVSMTDWLGTTTFELDLLHQLTAATDHRGNRVEYTYDGVGNQTEILYPDGTKAAYEYDLVHNQTKVTETDGSETTYAYDGMARVTEMRYPNGWVEYYTYDKMGRLLAVDDTHPSEKPAKTQKHTYKYDANGNMVYEYMRGNGTGQAKNETLYTYDALNRLVTAHDNYGNSTRTYTYDSLGNLTYETGNGSHNCDYIYNNLNQQIDRSSDNWKSHTASAYDKRGNLILEEYIKNKKVTTAGEYTYDETNKMVRGVNGNAEESIYTYNGLGALMENTWIIAKNGYGYHGVSADETTAPTDPTPDVPDPGETTDPEDPDPGETTDPDVPDPGETTDPETPDDGDDSGINNNGNGNNNGNNGNHYGNGNGNGNGNGKGSNSAGATETTAADAGVLTASLVVYGNAGNGNNGNNGNGNGNQDKPTGSDVKKTSTVVKRFVVDFSSETYKPLMEHEVNGLDYRYVYSDKARLSVVVQGIEHGSASLLDDKGELHAYYHTDYLGTTDYLTSAVNSKIISWTSYSEWGEITHNAVLKCGQRELDLVKEYATHDFDAVLNMYYAKARFYDADNRRFVAVDPILDPSQYDLREYVTDPMQLVQYLYVKDNAVNWVDSTGKIISYKDVQALAKITAKVAAVYPVIKNSAEYLSLHLSVERRDDVVRGIVASALITSGEAAAMLLQGLINSGRLLEGQLPSVEYFEAYLKAENQIDSYFYNRSTYKDSYYFGKVIGDVVAAGVGAGLTVKGILDFINGSGMVGTGILTSGSGVGAAIAAVGAVISAEGIATTTAGGSIVSAAIDKLPGDWDDLDYFRKVWCEGKKLFEKFDWDNLDDIVAKQKHFSGAGGNYQKFIGSSKSEVREIIRDAAKRGKIVNIEYNSQNSRYSVFLDAQKEIGTKGERFIKIVFAEDGGMVTAYPVKSVK